jgi:tetratricopeptide (TPR) repeat protein
MDRLEEDLKRIMQMASVIGRDFAYRILNTITGMGEDLKSHLVNLQGLEFIYEKSLFPELEYIFKHALTQEVAYESLLMRRRKEIHEKIGRAIEELYADRLEEFYEVLAHHYSRSENSEKALQYLELSGNKAFGNYAKWEALRYYQEAINLLDRQPQTEANKRKGIEIRLLMSIPMRYVCYPEGSLQVLEDGVRLSEEVGDERSLGLFYGLICFYYSLRGESLRGAERAEHYYRMAEKAGDVDLVAPLGFGLCACYWTAGEVRRVAEIGGKVLALLEESQRQSETFGWGFTVYAAMCAAQGGALAALGDIRKGEALFEKGLRYAQEMDDPHSIGWVQLCYGAFCMAKGDGEKAVELSRSSIRHLEETQFLTVMGPPWVFLGVGHYLLGQPEPALEYMEKGLEIQRSVGFAQGLSIQYYFVGLVHLGLGNVGEARSWAEAALEVAAKNNERTHEAMAKTLWGRILVKTDLSRGAEAEEHILQGIKTLNDQGHRQGMAMAHLLLADLYVDTGQQEKAQSALEKALTMQQEMGVG